MDPGWQFIKQDVSGAQATGFVDSGWSTVSTPHTYNDVDSYTKLINHSSGDVGSYTGPAWYRKHFKIPTQYSGGKVIVEFERIRQGAQFYINGVQVGVYDIGVRQSLTDKIPNAVERGGTLRATGFCSRGNGEPAG
jgi:beta-galactosidase